jgi:hypothetical protein
MRVAFKSAESCAEFFLKIIFMAFTGSSHRVVVAGLPGVKQKTRRVLNTCIIYHIERPRTHIDDA